MKIALRTLSFHFFFCLAFLNAYLVDAQVINAIGDFTPQVNAVLCQGTGNFTLTATTNAGGGLLYDPNEYEWVDFTGGNTTLTEKSNQLIVSNLLPGYHTYKVRGTVTSTSTCPGDFEEFTIYVLPPLTISIASSGNAVSNIYCTDNLPTSVLLSATVSPGTPVTEAFGYNYQWYQVEGATETAIAGATSSTYSVTNLAQGNIKYKVKATFKVLTACTYDSSTNATGGAVEIIVKPKPTKPVITLSMN
ncbi:MAG TPA: hypothetical protein VGD90_10615 [Sphingobacteriaceae bacterium]